MFCRVLEFTPKTNMMDQFRTKMDHDVLPMLRKHPGFVDLLTLAPEHNTEPFITISFWKTREMAEEYHKTFFPKVMEMIKPFLMETTPTITHYTVETSTFHKTAVAA